MVRPVVHVSTQSTLSCKGIAPSHFFQTFITWEREKIQQYSKEEKDCCSTC